MARLDIIIFGATGYTGKIAVGQLQKLANNITWGIAGRNEIKLQNILTETVKRFPESTLNNIPIITADVEDEESIKKMTAQAKVIINCCGPYDLCGEVVVKSCIETGTHYVDVAGESQFIDAILLKYHEMAKEKSVYIINACGLGSVPADLGICFLEGHFGGTINSVETYIHTYEQGGSTPGAAYNYSSWVTIINGIGNFRKINALKEQENANKTALFKPKLAKKSLHRVANGWALPVSGVDTDIVCRSQEYFYKSSNKRPIQIQNYVVIPSFIYVLLAAIFLLLIGILAQFKYGRSLLLKYPEFFSNGLFTHSPAEDKVERMRFTLTLKCQGWSEKLSDAADQYPIPPNKEIIGRVSGVNPGYGFTTLALTLCALIILKEPKNLPSRGGIYTPAIAFSKTSFVQQLQHNGVVFEVVSIKDI